MELSRGICVLCLNNTKIVVPPQAEDITNLLCEILKDFVDISKFQETTYTLKVCPSCLDDIVQVDKQRHNIKQFSTDSEECCLCHENYNLVSISDWTHFDSLLENINVKKGRHCSACVQCIHYLHQLDRLKVNFLQKYPNLRIKQLATPKKELLRSQGRKFSKNDNPISRIGNLLRNMKPLKYSKVNIDPYKKDTKLTEQIAFVNLVQNDFSDTNNKSHASLDDTDSSPNEYSLKSFFKIKLKMNKSKIQRVSAGRVRKPRKDITFLSFAKKELLVKIPKVDLKKLASPLKHTFDSPSDENYLSNQSTPTKASRKMMPEEILSSPRARKSVTFNEDLNEVITDDVSIENENSKLSTRKSVVKNSESALVDRFDTEVEDPLSFEERESKEVDSDDEPEVKKSYVEDIKQNNDSIFESLKGTAAKTNTNGMKNNDAESGITMRKKIISSPNFKNEYSKIDDAVKETNTSILPNDDKKNSAGTYSEQDLTDYETPPSESGEVATPKFTLVSDSEEDFEVTLKEYKELRLSGSEKSNFKKPTLCSDPLNGSSKKTNLKKRRISLIGGDESGEEPETKKNKVSEETVESTNRSDNVSDPTILPNKEKEVVLNDVIVVDDNTVSDSQSVISRTAVSKNLVEVSKEKKESMNIVEIDTPEVFENKKKIGENAVST